MEGGRIPFAQDREFLILFENLNRDVVHIGHEDTEPMYKRFILELMNDPKFEKYEKFSKNLRLLRNKEYNLSFTKHYKVKADIKKYLIAKFKFHIKSDDAIKPAWFNRVENSMELYELLFERVIKEFIKDIEAFYVMYNYSGEPNDYVQSFDTIIEKELNLWLGTKVMGRQAFRITKKFLKDNFEEVFHLIIEKLSVKKDRREMVSSWAYEARVQTIDGMYWNILRHIANHKMKLWASLYRTFGIDGFVDYGKGIIHQAEPEQAVFFDAKKLKVVEAFINPRRRSKPKKKKTVDDYVSDVENIFSPKWVPGGGVPE